MTQTERGDVDDSEAVKAAKSARANAKTLESALKQYVLAHFGDTNPAIADFGYSPRKVAQKSVAEKHESVEKQLATRAARHTMGSPAPDPAVGGTSH